MKYKDFVLSKYPESEYAQVIKNPNYFIDKQKSAEQIYGIGSSQENITVKAL